MPTETEIRAALEAINEVANQCLYPDGKDVVSSDPEGAGYIFYRKVIGYNLLHVIRTLLESQLSGGWKSIESAPRDGAWIMGYWPSMSIIQYPCICFADGSSSNPNAFETVSRNEYGSDEVYPTHWHKLPPSPTPSQKDGE